MANRKVTKVVIPVAGLGSRFLPATKALPKELLPIVDRPIIHFIVQEAVDAGLETVVFVTSRPKILIEDYFDPADLVSLRLAQAGKEALIEDVRKLSQKIDIVSVRQYEPRGLGHAVLQAAPIVEGQNFAVVLGDDIIRTQTAKLQVSSAIGQCLSNFEKRSEGSVIGVLEVPREQTKSYGIADFDEKTGQIRALVEKPEPAVAPSNWALPGRYVFESEIISALRETPPGKNNEIQLTDAMQRLLATRPFFAQKIAGERFDTGDKLGYIMANVAFALENPEHKETLREWLKAKLS